MTTKDPMRIKTFKRWRSEVRTALRQDWDQIIVITGDERTGKSTLAFRLADAIDPAFSLDRCVFRAREMIEKANVADPGMVVWLDEAISGGMSREAMSEPNRELVKYFTVAGERNLCYLVLWPNIRWLDSHIRDHRAAWWIHVEERGLARVYFPEKGGPFRDRPYWRELPFNPFSFDEVVGPGWEAYLRHKRAFVDETGRQYGTGGREDVEPSGVERIEAIVEDRGPWVAHLLEPLREWEPSPGADGFSTAERERLVGWRL